jgi:predicted enzyme related to lactoylglutathione lyase
MNFNSLMIGSEDPARLAAYYTQLFGDPTEKDDSYTSWRLGSGYVSIGPHSEVKGRNDSPGRIMWNIESGDVRADAERLAKAGAMVVAEPYNFPDYPDYWIATFEDPDGNYFQLMTKMDSPEG